ncbi:MAG: zinc ribbon domain-containing protein [Clostridiales bacterium]|nr:zinc ribbon domain-containing protein [Clostridiales bacterium]
MKTFCDYCGSVIDDTIEKCPNCGAVNVHIQRSGDQIPKTIEELQAFAQEKGIPLEKMRFFIGVDYKEPRAFGIYKEPSTGNCVVYKNKADGSRAVRYQGTDEAYAVNEIYQKMRAELLERKQADLDKGKTTNTYSTKTVKRSSRPKGINAIMWGIVISIAVMFGFAFIVMVINDSKTPNRGYYDYKGTPYYYGGGVWYTPDDDGEWERTYDAPDRLKENYRDYFEARDYSDLDSNYADDIEEYQTEADSNYNYDNDNDSWNDSNWDDNDWDYDYDSYDWGDSDWDSDW